MRSVLLALIACLMTAGCMTSPQKRAAERMASWPSTTHSSQAAPFVDDKALKDAESRQAQANQDDFALHIIDKLKAEKYRAAQKPVPPDPKELAGERERAWLIAGVRGGVIQKTIGFDIYGNAVSISVPVVQGLNPDWRIAQAAIGGITSYIETDCRKHLYRQLPVVYDVSSFGMWSDPDPGEVAATMIRRICAAPLYHERAPHAG